MRHKKISDTEWIIVLKRGEQIIEKLQEFLEKENISSGSFKAIGALSFVELAHFSLERKEYSRKKFSQPLEIVSLIGNVAVNKEENQEKIIHAHIVVGTEEMKLFGGHLVEGKVSATCEIIFQEFKEKVERKKDSETGLNLIEV